jgi:phage terminase large subunit
MEVAIGPRMMPHQLQAWESQQRFSILVWHRRAGKTVYAIKWLIAHTLSCELKNPRGAYLAPQYKQAKNIAWQYLKDFSRGIPGTTFNESELRADYPNGAQIRLLGAAEPDALRGLYLDAVCCDEMAQFAPRAWTEVIRPALADRTGKALLIGTVFGRANLFYEYYRDAASKAGWYSQLLKVTDTDMISEDEQVLIQQDMDEGEWKQEFLCDWDAAVKGSFYGEGMNDAEDQGRVGRVPHDDQLEVFTSWDLGMADSTVIWFLQQVGSEVRAIECVEFQGTGLPEIVRELRKRPYNYSDHYLPHDVKVRELGTGQSRYEVLMELGVNATIVTNHQVWDGIQATRSLIKRMWFDRENCFRGVEALKTYRSDYNDQRQVFNRTPLHSWESHFADSLRYYAMGKPKTDTWGKPLDYSALDRVNRQ